VLYLIADTMGFLSADGTLTLLLKSINILYQYIQTNITLFIKFKREYIYINRIKYFKAKYT
jgi:hypothetical protein